MMMMTMTMTKTKMCPTYNTHINNTKHVNFSEVSVAMIKRSTLYCENSINNYQLIKYKNNHLIIFIKPALLTDQTH